MRRSTIYIRFTAIAVLLTIAMVIHAGFRQKATASQLREHAGLVRTLKLTDLCLFTEARYTRHPSMADSFAPFQDHPGALEHFPSGSLISPPNQRKHATLP